jgi:hypothetical protein
LSHSRPPLYFPLFRPITLSKHSHRPADRALSTSTEIGRSSSGSSDESRRSDGCRAGLPNTLHASRCPFISCGTTAPSGSASTPCPPPCWKFLRPVLSSSAPCHSLRGPPSSPQPRPSAPNPNIRCDAPLCTRPITRLIAIMQSAEPRHMRTLRSTGRRDQAGGPPRKSRVGGRWRLVWRCTRSSSPVSRSARARAM